MGSKTRHLNDLITAYMKFTEDTEPPKSYHTWVAISMIAGALQRRVFLRWGYEFIYPNLYVILVGPSGHARKGTAMKIGKGFLKEIGINITSESVTREALIRAMQNSTNTFLLPNGAFRWHCSLTAISEELSVFLEQNDVKFLATLTDWYDAADEWVYETKGSGTDKLQGVCFNLLGGTAPSWLSSIFPEEAIGGGFTSRCIFVVEEGKGKTVAKPQYSEETQKLGELIRADLEKVMNLTGEMVMTQEAEQAYMDWYTEQEENMRNGRMPIASPHFDGYAARRATHVRKLAMVCSASRGDDMEITLDDFERAKRILLAAEKNMAKAFSGVGRSQYAQATETVIHLLQRNKKMKRSDLLSQVYLDMDTADLQMVKSTLQQMKVIKVTLQPGDGDEIYEWIGP